jgi:zinc protease
MEIQARRFDMKRMIGFAVLSCIVLWATVSSGQPLPSGMDRVTSVEGITEYKLANGLHVLVFPDPSRSTITVNITYLVGSRQEGSGERGMAHLLEHMVFKGSPKHTNIPQELTEHGSRPNGSTSYDRTNYFETFQATDENLKWALDLESDRMVNSFIRKTDLDSEFTVVRNEFEAGENNPLNVLFQRALSAAYLWHPYGRAVIGNRADIEHVPIDKLQAFYKKFYEPDNAVLTVSGKVDELKLLPLISDAFAPIAAPARTLETTYSVEPVQDGERQVTLRRVGDIQAVLAVYHVPAGSDPDFAAISVLMGLLGDNPSGRLYKALVDSKKAATVVVAGLQLNEPGAAVFGAILNKQDSVDQVRTILLETLDNLVKEPPSKEEVDRARTRLLTGVDLQLRNSEQIGLTMSEWVSRGDWRLLFLNRDRLRKVTPEDVQRVGSAYLKSSNLTLAEFIPDPRPNRAEIPPKADVAAMLKDYKGDAAMALGEAFDPSPANIEALVKRATLPSGMKISLLSKQTRGNTVSATIRLHHGTLDRLTGLDAVAGLAMQSLIRGTQRKDRQQIQDELDRLKARVSVGGGATAATATIETVRENLPAVLRLVGEILREPAFPESEFEQIKKLMLTSVDSAKSEPQVLASIELQRTLYPHPKGDVRAATTPQEEIENVQKVTLADARKFYREFVGASNAELSVVGDFDAQEIGRLASELFGGWKSPGAFEKVTDPYRKIEPVNLSIETPDKQNAMFVAGLRLNLTNTDADFPALVLANYMLGGCFLNSRLAARIRQKDGLSYGISSSLSAASKVKNGSFMVNAIAAPQNVAKVEAAVKEELDKAVRDGFTAEEVAAAKSGWLQSQKVSRSADGSLAATLAAHDFDEVTMAFDADLENKVASLTPQQIQDALGRNLDVPAMSIVKAGDFKKAVAAQ